MKILRTPKNASLRACPEFPYAPRLRPDVNGLRIHYIAEGTRRLHFSACMASRPWSFVYRKLFSRAVAAFFRLIAPDLAGFGRSDKPTELADHTLANCMADIVVDFVDLLDLHEVTLVVHDWGRPGSGWPAAAADSRLEWPSLSS